MIDSRPAPKALTDWVPFENPDLPEDEQPDFAQASMMGTCPTHGFEAITTHRPGGGSDPTELFIFACGEVDPGSFA